MRLDLQVHALGYGTESSFSAHKLVSPGGLKHAYECEGS